MPLGLTPAIGTCAGWDVTDSVLYVADGPTWTTCTPH